MCQYEDELNKRKEEINILSLAVNEYDKSTKTSSKVKLSDQNTSVNFDTRDRTNYIELKSLFEDAQQTISELNENLDSVKGENNQLKNDIQTLIDFKNELETLAEDQDKQIQNLNNTCERFTEQLKNKDETIQFLDTESKAKNNEIIELNKDIKHLMDERAAIIK